MNDPAQLHNLIRDNFRLDDSHALTSATRFSEDLDADSFNMITLACDIEQEFSIDLHDIFLDQISTIGELQTMIADLVKKDTVY